jgi:hypothetical protein
MEKNTTNNKTILPPINKRHTETNYDLFELKHGYKLPSTFDNDSKYTTILESETTRRTLPKLFNSESNAQKLRNMIKTHDTLPPIKFKSVREEKPSRMWCEKGKLDKEHGERYNPELHHGGDTAFERCGEFYKEYHKPEWRIKSGGKKKTRRNRKNKKSRKQRRKSVRH